MLRKDEQKEIHGNYCYTPFAIWVEVSSQNILRLPRKSRRSQAGSRFFGRSTGHHLDRRPLFESSKTRNANEHIRDILVLMRIAEAS